MIDYTGITDGIQTILQAGTYTDSIKEYLIEGMDRDMVLENMPFINVRMIGAAFEIRSLPNGYYAYLTFAIDVTTFDLSVYKKAAIVRNRILREVQLQLQSNRKFVASVETSTIGPRIAFSAGTAEDNDIVRGHVASATFDFVVEAYIEPT